jgi:signal transduction histidine kinase
MNDRGEPGYAEVLEGGQLRGARLACVVAALVVPAFAILDRVLIPDIAAAFLPYRIAVAASALLLLLLLRRPLVRPLLAATILAVVVAAMVTAFVITRHGHRSVYYAGHLLVMVGLNALVPLTLRQSALLTGAVHALYLFPVLAFDAIRDVPLFVSNNFFLATTFLLCVAGSAAADRVRRREHESRLGLARRAEALWNAVARLEAAQRLLVEQEQLAAQGRLAGALLHELANPLAYVTANLDLLQALLRAEMSEGRVPADAAAMLGESIEGVGRLNAVMAALRRQIRPGERARGEWVDLGSELVRAAVLCRQESARVEIHAEEGGAPKVRGRGPHLGYVFLNLLRHAVAGASGARPVTARAFAEGEKAVVEIVRDGAAIDPEEAERLFDPFPAQPEGDRPAAGLWLARTIVEEHGGTLTVQSERGVCFRVTLPPGDASRPADPGSTATSGSAH